MKAITTLPNVQVELNDRLVNPDDTVALERVTVHKDLSLPVQCELTFLAPTPKLSEQFQPGASLKLWMNGHQSTLFAGQVTAAEFQYAASGMELLHVRGYDALHILRTRQSGRVYLDMTPQSLAEKLANGLNLSVMAAESGPHYARLIHDQTSDFAVLRSVLDRCGLYMTLQENVLHLIALDGYGPPIELMLGDTLLEASVDVNAGFAAPVVSVNGWDVTGAETYYAETDEARSGRRIPADALVQLLTEEARGVVNELLATEAQALARAQAELDGRTAGQTILRGVADGNTELSPGRQIQVEGLAATLCGQYVLTSVCHTVDHERGFVSEISTEPPAWSNPPSGSTVALGHVVSVDDPEQHGRVRVSLPAFDDAETEWLGVLSAGAGSDKGLIMLPNVDDLVLVMLAQGNLGQGIVLGGLYGLQGTPESGVEDDSVRAYTLMTSSGQRFQIRESTDSITLSNAHNSSVTLTENTIRLENGDGSSLSLSPDAVQLSATRDVVIETPGNSLTLRASRINMERG